MLRVTVGWILAPLLLAAVPAAGGDLSLEIRQLRRMDCVAGREVGFDAGEGLFHALMRSCLDRGNVAVFESMARDDHRVVRAQRR